MGKQKASPTVINVKVEVEKKVEIVKVETRKGMKDCIIHYRIGKGKIQKCVCPLSEQKQRLKKIKAGKVES